MPAPRQTNSAREAAFRVLMEVEQESAYANLALKRLLGSYPLPAREARLAAQIVYGAVRRKFALDHIIARFLTQPIGKLMPEALVILRLSVFQLHYLDHAEPYAVTDEAVELAKRHANPPIARLVNAVLRNYLRSERGQLLPGPDDLPRYLAVTLSYPRWLVDRLIASFGAAEARCFCELENEPAGLYLRANTLRQDRGALLAALAAEGVAAEAAGFAPETARITGSSGDLARSPCFRGGGFLMQGAASQLVAHALAPAPGSRVLDLCAAPGGKTTHLAALMADRGEIRAFDLHAHKVKLILDNAARLGMRCIQAAAGDAAALPPAFQGWADYVLLDAPCSGLGVLNARPDSRYHKRPADIRELAALARGLLDAAAGYLKPGGLLCFSTCTVTEEENSGQIRDFLARRTDFRLAPMRGLAAMLPAAEDKAAAAAGQIQLLPQRHGTEGFFIALLQKEGDG